MPQPFTIAEYLNQAAASKAAGLQYIPRVQVRKFGTVYCGIVKEFDDIDGKTFIRIAASAPERALISAMPKNVTACGGCATPCDRTMGGLQ